MAVYERGSGPHIAERVAPVLGSPEAERYATLAADPGSGWRCVKADPEEGGKQPPPERPTKAAVKDEWVAYARSRAKDSDEEAAIDGLTKDELIEKYGGEGDGA
ncbi:hypothetical protein F9278_15925 [Streptomyces phaeolivaceus]|uniref:Uncharacterized protein n=1 Tax=Streptomyces phaeolivaceus TaxID=2653200 RepID=A0A5P8K2G9_9ACTN|nr:hypothetical protein [Streptomyces phaeolivaceus]QFQ97455.1 hypothetical protein F9278_15925 [Streptomyces phaeolivaceus]